MKKEFKEACVEVIFLQENEDIVTVSSGADLGDDDLSAMLSDLNLNQ